MGGGGVQEVKQKMIKALKHETATKNGGPDKTSRKAFGICYSGSRYIYTKREDERYMLEPGKGKEIGEEGSRVIMKSRGVQGMWASPTIGFPRRVVTPQETKMGQSLGHQIGKEGYLSNRRKNGRMASAQ